MILQGANGQTSSADWESLMLKSDLDIDLSKAMKSIDALAEGLKEQVGRSMAVAGGKIVRDEAKQRAPVFDGSTALKGGSTVTDPRKAGQLRDAIYLAFSDNRSDLPNHHVVYSVSWNSRLAPHGHLLEFGHWRYNVIAGGFPMKKELKTPVFVPAKSFLRPAFEATKRETISAMLKRGEIRLSELMKEVSSDSKA